MSFLKAKKSIAAHKGHYGIHLKSFNTLTAAEPRVTDDAMYKSYAKVQERLEKLTNSMENAMSLLEDKTAADLEGIDTEKEYNELFAYQEKLLEEQCEIEKMFAQFKASKPSSVSSPVASHHVEEHRATVRLTSLDPPSWNGTKADFYTWQKKFIHIMHEAKVTSELTQLCYLQNQKTLPVEYQALISDCSSISDVWARLEERIPKETITHEVVNEFRKLRPLPMRRSPTLLRDFANEISLFC